MTFDDTSTPPQASVSGEHERRLATNYLARQVSQGIAVLTGLGVITMLARRLSLNEFGTFALLLSLTTYLAVLQGIVETPAIKTFAETSDQLSRDRAFSTVMAVYSATGLAAGALIAGVGTLLLKVWTIPVALHHQADLAVLGLAIVTAVSWPTRVFYDTLRGRQLFALAAAAEVAALLVTGSLTVAFLLSDAPLWLVVVAAGSGSFATGLASAGIVKLSRLPYRLTRQGFSRTTTQAFLKLSGYFLVASLADFVIYSLDRTILGAFRSAAAVGLYEAPLRAHNLVRDVQATVVTPVLPAAARYHAEGDTQRLRELMLRGTRYTVAIVVPLVVVAAILARPILEAWLGERFGAAAPAMAILVGYWLVIANTSVGWQMLVAVGQIRKFSLYAVSVALVNAALSLALTPRFGLNGIVLGTTIPYVVAFPAFLRLALPEFDVRLGDLAREVWLPAYSTAIVIAAALAALRWSVDLATIPACAAAGLGTLLAYWSIYYTIWLRPDERLLARTLVRGILRR